MAKILYQHLTSNICMESSFVISKHYKLVTTNMTQTFPREMLMEMKHICGNKKQNRSMEMK